MSIRHLPTKGRKSILVRLGRIDYSFSSNFNKGKLFATISPLDTRFDSKNQCTVIKRSNSNGAALTQVVTKLRQPDNNSIFMSNTPICKQGQTKGRRFEGIRVVRRGSTSTLSPGVPIKGSVRRPLRYFFRVRGRGQQRHYQGLVRLYGLSQSCCAHLPSRLSNKRRGQITVTETLTTRPRYLVFSRTAGKFSLPLQGGVVSRVVSLRRRLNFALVFVARSVRLTIIITSRVFIVQGSGLMRHTTFSNSCSMFRSPCDEVLLRTDNLISASAR